jgi:hypothetical protein
VNPDPGRRRAAVELDLTQACVDAVSAVVNARYGSGLPALSWQPVTTPAGIVHALVGQVPGGPPDHDAQQALQAWAGAYDLAPVADPVPGTSEVAGFLDGVPARIWAVTDRATFEGQHPTTSNTKHPGGAR